MKRFAVAACLLVLLLLVPPALADGPSITGITPVSGPNNGVVTITVTGSGFSSLSDIRLNKCRLVTGGSSEAPFSGTVISKSGTSVTARFDLTGKIAGSYDLSLNAPFDGHEAWAVASGAFTVYGSSGQPATAVTTSYPATSVATTTTTPPPGDNSVYFESYPPGATIFLDGENIGTAPFIYYTNREGTFNVACWLSGYEEYEATVNIVEGKQVHFIAPLSVLSRETTTATTAPATSPATATTTAVTTATATPATTPAVPGTTPPVAGTTATRFTINVPTPWPTNEPTPMKESPAGPALAPAAAALAAILAVFRRR